MDWMMKNWPFLVFGFNLLVGLIVAVLHKTYAKSSDLEQLDKRVAIAESIIEKTEMHKVVNQLEGMKGEMDGLKQLLARANSQLDMLVENELAEKRKP